VARQSYPDVLGMIEELQDELSRIRTHTPTDLHEVARRRIEAPQAVFEWAKRNRRWSFTLAELLRDPTERPRDLAARLVLAIADELEQERETLSDSSESSARQGEMSNRASTVAIAD
jgi:hypothetical protein